MKTIYACFCTDVIHEGHINLIRTAKQYGRVIAGVLSDAAMIRYNRFPVVSFEERAERIRSIPGVDEVVIQQDMMYDAVIASLLSLIHI